MTATSGSRKRRREDAAVGKRGTKKARREDQPIVTVPLPHSAQQGQNLRAKSGARTGTQKPKNGKVRSSVGNAEQETAYQNTRKGGKKARRTAQSADKANTLQSKDEGIQKLPNKEVIRDAIDGNVRVQGRRDDESYAKWTLSAPTAGRFINHDPMFVIDKDGEQYLISANDREVQVLSINTSLVVRTLQAPEGASVRCFAPGSRHGSRIVVAYSCGEVVTWEWSSKQGSTTLPCTFRGDLLAMDTSITPNGEAIFTLSKVEDHFAILKDGQTLFVTTQPLRYLQVLDNSEHAVACGPSTLVLGRTKCETEKSDNQWLEIPLADIITTVDIRVSPSSPGNKMPAAKRPQDVSIALGTTEGQIYLYEDVASLFDKRKLQSLSAPRILHWHREAVSAVKFSGDGNYLISGGTETVLVLWQLDTGKKQFLPHLTSNIQRIVVNPEGDRYALQMGDNSIMVLSTSELKPVANFAGLQLSNPKDQGESLSTTTYAVAAILHPRHPHQLLLTASACVQETARPFLQTFDLLAARHVTRQALTRNNVTDFNTGPERTPIAPPDVVHLAISTDGHWLATVDEWMPPATDVEHMAVEGDEKRVEEERKKRREVYLKIWKYNEGQGLWYLTTRFDAPHARADKIEVGAGRVFQLVSSAKQNAFVTIGEDGSVKTWRPKARESHGGVVKDDQHVETVEWTCWRSTRLPGQIDRADSPIDHAEAQQWPSGACLACAEDGSMLAASMIFHATSEPVVVHFIDAYSGGIVASKAGIIPVEPVTLAYLDRYLISLSHKSVHVWDLVDDRVKQRYTLANIANPHHSLPLLGIQRDGISFAVAVAAHVICYRTDEQRYIYQRKVECPIAAILPSSSKGYTVISTDGTIRTLMPSATAAQPRLALPAADDQLVDGAEGVSIPEDAYSPQSLELLVHAQHADPTEEQEQLSDRVDDDDRPVVRPEQLAKVLDVGQSFAMPPVKDMFHAVVELFCRKPLPRHDAGEVALG